MFLVALERAHLTLEPFRLTFFEAQISLCPSQPPLICTVECVVGVAELLGLVHRRQLAIHICDTAD